MLMVWIVVAIYAVLFMNWDTKDTPFDGVSIFPRCESCEMTFKLIIISSRSERISFRDCRVSFHLLRHLGRLRRLMITTENVHNA